MMRYRKKKMSTGYTQEKIDVIPLFTKFILRRLVYFLLAAGFFGLLVFFGALLRAFFAGLAATAVDDAPVAGLAAFFCFWF